jgi:hypothetical protein
MWGKRNVAALDSHEIDGIGEYGFTCFYACDTGLIYIYLPSVYRLALDFDQDVQPCLHDAASRQSKEAPLLPDAAL